MPDQIKPPVGGGNPRAPKRVHGRGWLLKRLRNGLNWQQRKARSRRYCAPTSPRTMALKGINQ